MANKLKNCPFCNSREIEIFETDSGIAGLSGEYYACCTDCYAQTGLFDNKPDAIKWWNMRTKK